MIWYWWMDGAHQVSPISNCLWSTSPAYTSNQRLHFRGLQNGRIPARIPLAQPKRLLVLAAHDQIWKDTHPLVTPLMNCGVSQASNREAFIVTCLVNFLGWNIKSRLLLVELFVKAKWRHEYYICGSAKSQHTLFLSSFPLSFECTWSGGVAALVVDCCSVCRTMLSSL